MLCIGSRKYSRKGKQTMNCKQIEHLKMIQDVITRMASNSFSLKGWAVTLVAAIFALTWANISRNFLLIALIPIFAFWALDAYYLNLERKNRKLYDKVRKMDEEEIDFSMDASLPELQDQTTCYWSCFWSNTEKKFYLPLLAVVIIPPLVTAFPYIMNMKA